MLADVLPAGYWPLDDHRIDGGSSASGSRDPRRGESRRQSEVRAERPGLVADDALSPLLVATASLVGSLAALGVFSASLDADVGPLVTLGNTAATLVGPFLVAFLVTLVTRPRRITNGALVVFLLPPAVLLVLLLRP
jgi:hypothetical protein